jgi:hypothetical protein
MFRQLQEDKMPLRVVAGLHNIGHETLRQRALNPTEPAAAVGRPPVLDAAIEAELAKVCKEARALGWGYTQMEVQAAARKIAAERGAEGFTASAHWLKGFLRRNALKGLKPKRTTTSRLTGANRGSVASFYDVLERALAIFEKKTGRPATGADIANMDETGFKPDTAKGSKVVVGKEDHACFMPTSSSCGHVTAMYCGDASGKMMPTTLIMEGVEGRSSYLAGAGDFKLSMGPEGFVDVPIFLAWLEEFSKWREGKTSILVLDWHSSRSALHAGLAAFRLGIIIVMLPPNCTHVLQPADRAVFRALKQHFSSVLQTLWAGRSITKDNVASLIYAAHLRLQSGTVDGEPLYKVWISGFRKCGIWPLDRHALTDADYACADAIASRIATFKVAKMLISQPPATVEETVAAGAAAMPPRESTEEMCKRIEARNAKTNIKVACMLSAPEYLAEEFAKSTAKTAEDNAKKERATARKSTAANKVAAKAAGAVARVAKKQQRAAELAKVRADKVHRKLLKLTLRAAKAAPAAAAAGSSAAGISAAAAVALVGQAAASSGGKLLGGKRKRDTSPVPLVQSVAAAGRGEGKRAVKKARHADE